jgi:nitroimidazol reductase NimA-like FMN-containing flavoprotein (pyridoxamine 5'-phosphate oxidase superfamily)
MATQPVPSNQGPSKRTTLVRGDNRAVYGMDEVKAILADGIIAHVGVNTPDGPIVLPMAYSVRDDEILIHGSIANAILRAGKSVDVCVTVTIVDGLVVARTPLHNSMNYRSVVIRGEATRITEPGEHQACLKLINDHIAPIWDTARPPNEADYKQTMVLSVPLAESSAKVRGENAIDEPADVEGPHWAGVVPLISTWGKPIPAPDLGEQAGPMPATVAELVDTNAHPL